MEGVQENERYMASRGNAMSYISEGENGGMEMNAFA